MSKKCWRKLGTISLWIHGLALLSWRISSLLELPSLMAGAVSKVRQFISMYSCNMSTQIAFSYCIKNLIKKEKMMKFSSNQRGFDFWYETMKWFSDYMLWRCFYFWTVLPGEVVAKYPCCLYFLGKRVVRAQIPAGSLPRCESQAVFPWVWAVCCRLELPEPGTEQQRALI